MSGRGESVRVRRATRDDWPRMVELESELARFEKLPEPSDAEAARLGAMIFDEARAEALVAELDGSIAGMAIFWEALGSSFRAQTFLFLEDLVVSGTARSRGVGEALMAELAREGVRRKVQRIDWFVLDWNEGAMRSYRRVGATQATDWVRYSLPQEAMEKLARGGSTRSARPRGL